MLITKYEINGVTYEDGDTVKSVKKNFFVCGFTYSVKFYGYDYNDEYVFKHFLTVRMLFKTYKWTFKTKYLYEKLPYTD